MALDPKHAADLRSQASDEVPGRVAEVRVRQSRPIRSSPGPQARYSRGRTVTSPPPQLATSLARAAERQGDVFRRAAVQRVTAGGSSVRVTTSDGDLRGGYGGDRRGRLGQRDRRGADAAAAAGARTTPAPRMARRSAVHDRLGAPLLHRPARTDGLLLVGATVERVGFDERTTAGGRCASCSSAACELLPDAKRRDLPGGSRRPEARDAGRTARAGIGSRVRRTSSTHPATIAMGCSSTPSQPWSSRI